MRRAALFLVLGLALRPVFALDLAAAWQAALASDPEYAAAQAGGAAGAARAEQARALWRPELAVSGSAGLGTASSAVSGARFAAPGFGQSDGVAFESGVAHGLLTRVGVTARQPLLNGERDARRRQLEASATAADFEREAARQQLGVRVAEAWTGLALAEEAVRVTKRQLDAVQAAERQTRDRFALGDLPVTDTHEAAARAQAVRAQWLAAQSELELRRAALADLTALDPAGLSAPLPGAGVARWAPVPLERTLAEAMLDNPGLRARQAQLEMAQGEIDRHAAGANTSVDLVAQFGHDRLAGAGEFGSRGVQSSTNGLLGVAVMLPIDVGGGQKARRAEAASLKQKAEAELARARQQVAAMARAAWLGVQSGRSRVEALEQARIASQARLDATRVGQEVGDRTTLDRLNAEADASAADLMLAQARAALLQDRVRLAAAAGRLDDDLMRSIDAEMRGGAAR